MPRASEIVNLPLKVSQEGAAMLKEAAVRLNSTPSGVADLLFRSLHKLTAADITEGPLAEPPTTQPE